MKPTTLAHFADTHLGYQKDAALQKLESETFEYAISDTIQRGVGAVLFCGDTFHVNIPEVRVQKLAIKQLMRLKENNIPVYTIYGSHDFSPLSNSFIDVLVAAGLMQKLSYTIHEGRVRPTPTHVGEYCIMGLPGLKLGRDAELYRVLDRKYVRSNQPDIFLFHGDISGTYDMMSAEMLPADCKLYLGGHIHDYSMHNNIIYPGTLFGGHPNDMYNSARGALSKKPKLPTFFDTYGGAWTGRNAQGRHRITFLVLAGPSSMAVHVQYCAASPTLWGD